jgi:Superinfection immunity protein/Short C-terminal domain
MTTALVILVIAALYFVPSVIAYKRNHAYKNIILVINLIFGLTGIGWAAAAIWAIWPSEKSLIDPVVGNVTGTGQRNSGDTFGAKAFGEQRGYSKEQSDHEKIKELANLFASGAITESEFTAMKRKIIEG